MLDGAASKCEQITLCNEREALFEGSFSSSEGAYFFELQCYFCHWYALFNPSFMFRFATFLWTFILLLSIGNLEAVVVWVVKTSSSLQVLVKDGLNV